jgi:SpoU rRNA Methylase family
MAKPVLTPAEAARRLRAAAAQGIASGLLFGNERAGLSNDEVALADCIITVPTDPGFSSLNLGQAVLLIGYEWFRCGDATPPERIDHGGAGPAPRDELIRLFEHLEARQPPRNDPEFAEHLAPRPIDRSGGPHAQGCDRGLDQGKTTQSARKRRLTVKSPWL